MKKVSFVTAAALATAMATSAAADITPKTGMISLPAEAPAVQTGDILMIELNGSMYRLAGLEEAGLTGDDLNDAVIDLEAFYAQGTASCMEIADGVANCMIGDTNVSEYIASRDYALLTEQVSDFGRDPIIVTTTEPLEGQLSLPKEAPIAFSDELLRVELNGIVYDLAGLEDSGLTGNDLDDAARDLEAFYAQGEGSCDLVADGTVTCTVEGVDVADYIVSRTFATAS